MTMSTSSLRPSISVIVISFNMEREIPRTVYSLSTKMQKLLRREDYEVIVVDNGSPKTQYLDRLNEIELNLSVLRIENPTVSPAPAINLGLNHAKGNLIGVMIDGARMASPGLLMNVMHASSLHPRPVIATLGFHLGHEVQMKSIHNGYNQEIEDRLLESVDWTEDGYRLFDISVFAGASAGGWFAPTSESNALFMTRSMWDELGGYDCNFASPGGGVVNLDTYKRACELPGSQLIRLLGEGTFHQIHGGVATNSKTPVIGDFFAEYKKLKGCDFKAPLQTPWYFGSLDRNWKLARNLPQASSSQARVPE